MLLAHYTCGLKNHSTLNSDGREGTVPHKSTLPKAAFACMRTHFGFEQPFGCMYDGVAGFEI